MLVAYLHAFTGGPSANTTDPPVTSGFRIQITDIRPNYQFFGKPVPEAFFLNDVPSSNPQGVFAPTSLSVLNQTPRLLTAPYPVTPPGLFKVEFWNILQSGNVGSVNPLVSLAFLVAVPDPDMKKGD